MDQFRSLIDSQSQIVETDQQSKTNPGMLEDDGKAGCGYTNGNADRSNSGITTPTVGVSLTDGVFGLGAVSSADRFGMSCSIFSVNMPYVSNNTPPTGYVYRLSNKIVSVTTTADVFTDPNFMVMLKFPIPRVSATTVLPYLLELL